MEYDESEQIERELSKVEEIAGYRASDRTIWVDVEGLGDEAMLRALGEAFGLHPLALENAVNVPQRAKSDLYKEYQLIIARTPDVSNGKLALPQVCLVVDDHCVVSFQERAFGFFEPVRERIRQGIGPIRSGGAGYLAYALLDTLMDHYYPVAQSLIEQLEEIEEVIARSPGPSTLQRIHELRRQVVALRRVGWPQRESLNALLRERSPYFDDTVRTYLRDSYDHIAQIVELLDSAREQASDLADLYLSTVSHRTNEVMKVLTIMASIFIPLTFVAGIYGMNFENMPELHAERGYYVVIALMAAMAAGMYLYFRRRGWIGEPGER
jgi:magnesium transporter